MFRNYVIVNGKMKRGYISETDEHHILLEGGRSTLSRSVINDFEIYGYFTKEELDIIVSDGVKSIEWKIVDDCQVLPESKLLRTMYGV